MTRPPAIAAAKAGRQSWHCSEFTPPSCKCILTTHILFSYVKEKGIAHHHLYDPSVCPSGHEPGRVHIRDVISLPSGDEYALAEWVAKNGAAAIQGFPVTRYLQTGYKRGVYRPTPSECYIDFTATHAMGVVGYDLTGEDTDGLPYWIVKNSWGAEWADEGGYLKILFGSNTCGLANRAVSAIAA